jgi:hypothetical protein
LVALIAASAVETKAGRAGPRTVKG